MTTVADVPVGAVESLEDIPYQRQPQAGTRAVVQRWVAPYEGSVERIRASSRVIAYVVDRAPLVVVMAVVSVLAGRLMITNTAFLDEAGYLNAGRVIWHNWMTGGPSAARIGYERYFSGSPVIYPIVANAANAIGGLVAARILSLLFVLVTLWMLDMTARQLFDRRVAAWAVAAFATVQGTQFLGAFATYDAMAMMLMTIALAVSVRKIGDGVAPAPALLLGAPILALANATKYATALFDPVVVALVALVVIGRFGVRHGLRMAALYTAIVAALLSAGVAFGGPAYVEGINDTTLQRPSGGQSAWLVWRSSWQWVGLLGVIGLIVVVVLVARLLRMESRDKTTVTTALGVIVLTIAVALVPIEQARIHTTVSLHKQVTFGAWFTAIAAGLLLAQVAGKRLVTAWRWIPAVAVVGVLGVAGTSQAKTIYQGWPNSNRLVSFLQPHLDANNKPILMDDSDVGQYYLPHVPYQRWQSSYYLRVRVAGTNRYLVGLPAFHYALAHDRFGLLILDYGPKARQDDELVVQMKADPNYHLTKTLPIETSYGPGRYEVWTDNAPSTSP
jgi:hypothetical protein